MVKTNMPMLEGFGYRNIQNLGQYNDLHLLSDTLLLADVFETFRNKCLEIYELDTAHCLSAPGLK